MSHALALLAPTPGAWLDAVLGDFAAFLSDHASCEKKASGMALAIASHYPDKPALLTAMADLAVEELAHYREVVALMTGRGVVPRPDTRDRYVRALTAQMRRGTAAYLTDRLLVAAIVERRGHERFALLADALEEPALRRFYRGIARSEDRHWSTFLDFAWCYAEPGDDVAARAAALLEAEAAIIAGLPMRAALH